MEDRRESRRFIRLRANDNYIWVLEDDLVVSFIVEVEPLDVILKKEEESNVVKKFVELEDNKKIQITLEFVKNKDEDTYPFKLEDEDPEGYDYEKKEEKINYDFLKNNLLYKVNLRFVFSEEMRINSLNEVEQESFCRWIRWFLSILSLELGCKICLFNPNKNSTKLVSYLGKNKYHYIIPEEIPILFLENSLKLLPDFPQFAFLELYHILEYLVYQFKMKKFEDYLKLIASNYLTIPSKSSEELFKEFVGYTRKFHRDKEWLIDFLKEIYPRLSPKEFYKKVLSEDERKHLTRELPFRCSKGNCSINKNDFESNENFSNRVASRIYEIRNAIAHSAEENSMFKISEEKHVDFLQKEVRVFFKLVMNILSVSDGGKSLRDLLKINR